MSQGMTNETRQKILLLNPPGNQQYFRDYYCAKVSKASYYYHPVDLVYLSGTLSKVGDVSVLDSIAEKLDIEKSLSVIDEQKPDIVIALCSAPSYTEDIKFLLNVFNTLDECKIIVTGDIFRDYKEKSLNDHPFLDAILLDFSTNDILEYLNRDTDKVIPNVIYRSDSGIIDGSEKHSKGVWDIPLPEWNKFKLDVYHFPFARRKPFASILTDFGCPFTCDFCPVSTLSYKLRPVDDVIEEMKLLKSLGVRELYVRDQTFGVSRKRTFELLDAIVDSGLNFSWTALTRTDVLDDNLLKRLKRAGCHTLMIGLESANDELMSKHKKNTKLEEAKNAINQIKSAGIKVGGFFMLGFPGESVDSINETAKIARKLPLDYASFNIVSPRFGTEFRRQAISDGVIDPLNLEAESSLSIPIWKNQQFSNSELMSLKKKAVRSFYLRPAYLLKRLFDLRTFYEFVNLVREGYSLLKKT